MSARPTGRRRWRWWFGGGLAVGGVAGALTFALVTGSVATGGAEPPPTPTFVEETVSSGLQHVYDGGFEFYVGGGAAVLDCDEDGFDDLYLAGGEDPASLYRNTSTLGSALTFERVPDPVTDLTEVTGAYPLDVDADGTTDLAVLRVGENVLLRGLGGCEFERANERWGFDGGQEWTAAFSATWEGGGLPTLAVGNYLALPLAADNSRGCAPSALHRPDGDGYGTPVLLEPGLCALSVLFHDWDRTGRADLRMANDRHYYTEGGEQLWQVEPGQPPRLYTREDGWQALSIWGMGIALSDVTDDGLPEVVLSSQGDNKLQTLRDGPGRPTYEDIAIRAGTTAHRPFMGDMTLPSTAWHVEFDDVNNDAHPDLFLAKGNVEAQPDHAADDPSNLLLANGDGTFVERAREAGVVSLGHGRGAALVDLNLDGLLDLVEVERGENARVWRNLGAGTEAPEPMGSWLAVRLEQPGSNRDAIGAWLEVRADGRTQSRQVTVGGGHAGGQHGWVHVGLGTAQRAEVRVQWPDGEWGPWQPVEVDGFVVLDRDVDTPVPWAPPTRAVRG